MVQPDRRLHNLAQASALVDRIGGNVHQGNRGHAEHLVGAGQDAIAQVRSLLLEPHRLGPQHQVGKVHIPLVRRHVGTLGHITQVAEIAVVYDLVVICLVDTVHLHGLRLIDQVEQGGKRLTETDAPTAAVTDVIDSLKLFVEIVLVPELFRLPVQGMTGGCLQAAFSHFSVLA